LENIHNLCDLKFLSSSNINSNNLLIKDTPKENSEDMNRPPPLLISNSSLSSPLNTGLQTPLRVYSPIGISEQSDKGKGGSLSGGGGGAGRNNGGGGGGGGGGADVNESESVGKQNSSVLLVSPDVSPEIYQKQINVLTFTLFLLLFIIITIITYKYIKPINFYFFS
jgi:hypothetical protein